MLPNTKEEEFSFLDSDGKSRIFSGNGKDGFAGDGLEASKAIYNGIHNLARASNGDLYVSDTRNNLVRKIDGRTNITSTIAGIPGKKGFSGDGGLASRAKLADRSRSACRKMRKLS